MKAIALLYLLTAGISPAQVVDDSGLSHQHPVRTGETPGGVGLSGVAVLDSEAVVAVGSYGTILRTTDWGATRKLQSSGTNQSLRAVSFTDVNAGTVVSSGG